jgi:hypothetical protein
VPVPNALFGCRFERASFAASLQRYHIFSIMCMYLNVENML